MDSQAKTPDSKVSTNIELPIGPLMPGHTTRRQLLKTALIGAGGLAAFATGLTRLETVFAAPLTPGGWRQLSPKATPNPQRQKPTVAYDAARGGPVLFGGGPDADTWTWDGATWIRQNPPLSPPARSGASLAYYPPTKTVVLFGGVGTQGWLDDTWLWNGKTWTAVPSTGPVGRTDASMAFDPISGNLILFGGFADGLLRDTWGWDGKSWRALSPHADSPPPHGGSLAYSAIVGKLIHFGGTYYMGAHGAERETWAWDGMNWSEVSFGTAPPARTFAAMTADPTGKLIFLFGGTGNGLLGDTWTFTGKWLQDTRLPAPPPRLGGSLVPTPSTNSLLLFGGWSIGSMLTDTWTWGPI